MNKKNRSNVWNFVDKDPNFSNQVICKFCKFKIKYANNTSNVWDHLRRKHITALEANRLSSQNEERNDINVSNKQSSPSTSSLTMNVNMREQITKQT
ncbi:uncharacterized protein LOC126902547 [Daktulosphaira vitifoliae]|uniref:uncharacterized protein LOC126902547 n=1 Tax=Daktulosphaira vitifoliae TaxID=58002 RepID=UPI0021AAF512|nr:uncharacterized protein LOC126902547 [Daktulosphaira vitifoliae]